MKICHIVAHVDEEASGPSYSVPRLTRALAEHGHEVILATLDRGGGEQTFGKVRHEAFIQAKFPTKLGWSPEMHLWLKRARASGISLIHSHGLWMMPNIYPARTGIPHIVAPRGMLDPAALIYSRFAKAAFWILAQGKALHNAAAFHATSELEAAHIRAQRLRQPIILSPNGIDIPLAPRPKRAVRRTLLYLGRLHEKKGLDMLLTAWKALEFHHPDWDLRIVGKGSPTYEAWLAQQVARLGLSRVTLEGPAYGAAKANAFAHADLFVLPTRGENFGMVVAEALASGTPVVTTTGAPWQGLTKHQAGWWCAPELGAIGAALGQALAMPRNALEKIGARGRAWMQTDYGWDTTAAAMSQAYRWLLVGGERPACILTD
jgi:glycosyltransferase involved in cell wall biosynthesis